MELAGSSGKGVRIEPCAHGARNPAPTSARPSHHLLRPPAAARRRAGPGGLHPPGPHAPHTCQKRVHRALSSALTSAPTAAAGRDLEGFIPKSAKDFEELGRLVAGKYLLPHASNTAYKVGGWHGGWVPALCVGCGSGWRWGVVWARLLLCWPRRRPARRRPAPVCHMPLRRRHRIGGALSPRRPASTPPPAGRRAPSSRCS